MITSKDFKNKIVNTKQKEANYIVETKLAELLNEKLTTDEIYFTIENCQKDYIDEINEELVKRGFINIHFGYKDDTIFVYFKIN